jgi:hypothetical protein
MADREMSEPTTGTELTPVKRALLAVEDMRRRLDAAEARQHEPIAIVGMACRFPGQADDPDQYWQLLRDGWTPWARSRLTAGTSTPTTTRIRTRR